MDTTDSITEAMCKQSKAAFGDPDDFTDNGGLKVMNFFFSNLTSGSACLLEKAISGFLEGTVA